MENLDPSPSKSFQPAPSSDTVWASKDEGQTNPTIMTPADQRYEEAKKHGIPPYMWIPPEQPPLQPTGNARTDAFLEGGPFEKNCEQIQKKEFEKFPGEEYAEPGNELRKHPHPLSDYSHVDPTRPGSSRIPDFQKLKDRFPDPKHDKEQREDLEYLQDLEHKVGSKAPGFQRLKMAFDLILCRTNTLLKNVNEAVGAVHKAKDDSEMAKAQEAYKHARKEYIEFIRNLDDHEPQTKPGQVIPERCLGYGKNIKWVYIEPVIALDSVMKIPFIKGATVVIEWNPHSSSSGIPVQHPSS